MTLCSVIDRLADALAHPPVAIIMGSKTWQEFVTERKRLQQLPPWTADDEARTYANLPIIVTENCWTRLEVL